MKHILVKLWKDESGVTAVEYGLIAGLTAALLVVLFSMFGDALKDLFGAITDKLGEEADEIRQD